MNKPRNLVVVGAGMAAWKFCQRMKELDTAGAWRITLVGEEPIPPYDRVHLTSWFSGRDAGQLELSPRAWYDEQGIRLVCGEKVIHLDRQELLLATDKKTIMKYDRLVIATGSQAFVPALPGIDIPGVFVYRTIQDLQSISEYARFSRKAAIIGGGLLGLEAAKAALDLGLETTVVETNDRPMSRQLDHGGARHLRQKIENMGVRMLTQARTSAILGITKVTGLSLNDDQMRLDCDMVIMSAGIRPNDQLARMSGLMLGSRGGIAVDEHMLSSDPSIYAIGEVASHNDFLHGLVVPCYDMASAAAAHLCGTAKPFGKADLSTKLKLMGVDVGSLGDAFAVTPGARSIVHDDGLQGKYFRLVTDEHGQKLLGAILVGDGTAYGRLHAMLTHGSQLPENPLQLVLPAQVGAHRDTAPSIQITDDTELCKCHAVRAGQLRKCMDEKKIDSLENLCKLTKAGTGCGGCLGLVGEVFQQCASAAGQPQKKQLCEHFNYSRSELFEIVRVCGIRDYQSLLQSHGQGLGCEVCKPAVASILASLWNEDILEHAAIQDSNDRFLANLQRGGSYSVVPRIPGGEIKPEQLIVLGQVAKKYDLYCKITGGQRIDLFGARVEQLPLIWSELIAAGFESGHAYGKALRTVKSCVGNTWCRFGLKDSISFAIDIENRYKGLRAPHKIKCAVSGCIRECAEAQSKDIGLIATENGWNLYVCGNGGARPQHATLLAENLDEDTAIRYMDRFLIYYIRTADKLMRTAPWLNQLEGGIEHLRDVVIRDSLNIAAELERQMQHHVDTYRCEWRQAVENPDQRRHFRSYANVNSPDMSMAFGRMRGQKAPVNWAGEISRHVEVAT